MTYLQLINKVLVGLRETQVAAVPTSGYPALVAQLVNEAKQDIEDLGPWRALRQVISVAPPVGVDSGVALTGTNDRSYLIFVPNENVPMAFITTSGYERRLSLITQDHLASLQQLYPDAGNSCPTAVSITTGGNSNESTPLTAFFWPRADVTYTARLDFIVPQAELTVSTTELKIPARPVWQLALTRAMEERGEEFAGSIDSWRARADRSLEAAILTDFGSDPMTFTAE